MTTKIPLPTQKSAPASEILPVGLLKDLRQMIDQSRQSIASTINSGLSLLYWNIGSRISKETLQNERAEY